VIDQPSFASIFSGGTSSIWTRMPSVMPFRGILMSASVTSPTN
jgi:hypothetical protein